MPAHSAWLAGQHPRGAQSAEIAMPRAFQRLAWLELLMVFGTVTEAGRISGTGRVQAHAQGHMWPTGFSGVYEIDRDTYSDIIVDFCTTAVEVASKVAYSGPNAAAKKEILNSSEASVCPPPLQTSQDAAPLNHMALTEISRPNRVATSLDSSTEPKLCMRRKVLEYPMDIVDILPRREPITDMGLVNATNSLKMSTELRLSTTIEMREHRIHGTCSYVPLVLHPYVRGLGLPFSCSGAECRVEGVGFSPIVVLYSLDVRFRA